MNQTHFYICFEKVIKAKREKEVVYSIQFNCLKEIREA